MKEILTYMENNPGVTVFALLVSAYCVISIFRSIAIMVKGWPKADEEDPIDLDGI